MLSSDNMAFGLRREKTAVRRRQIVEATLSLLADCPLDQLTTRQIARALGVSQPALFRHFTSREQLLLGVIAHTAESLGTVVQGVALGPGGALERLEALGLTLLEHLDTHPGLPRLLFANVASGEGPVLDALRSLYAVQRSLVTELVREGQRAGEIDPRLEPHDAATLFVGALQSVTLIRRLDARDGSLVDEGRRLLAIWRQGVRTTDGSAASAVDVPSTPHANGLRALDVRPVLARGVDPLEVILEQLDAVGPSGVLVLTAPFRPAPLLRLLVARGHGVRDQQVGPEEFVVEITHGSHPLVEELCDLEPPEPLERVLTATATLAPGGVYLARLPRNPRLLLPRLGERGLDFRVHEARDGTALLRVYRPR